MWNGKTEDSKMFQGDDHNCIAVLYEEEVTIVNKSIGKEGESQPPS